VFPRFRHFFDLTDTPVLTDYVATRWYRAPEILLGSTKYTKGVDMWSIGCILGELLGGHPLFPGESTMDQLSKVIEITGVPSKSDIKSIESSYRTSMLEKAIISKQKSLAATFPNASREALDLLHKLLQFNPEKRIDAETALRHPYLAQFHNPDDEPVLTRPITITIDDNKRYVII
jgi:mitogen-activated protein kinase 15